MHNAWGEKPGKQLVDLHGYNRPSWAFNRCPKTTVDPMTSIFPPGRYSILATLYMSIIS